MSFFDFLRRERIVGRVEPRVEFLGEQDGAPERELKAQVVKILERFPSVQRAYLARVGYQPAGQTAVAICMYSDHPNVAAAGAIGDAFHALFSKGSFVDLFFLSAEQDVDAARVCRPFYSRAGSLGG